MIKTANSIIAPINNNRNSEETYAIVGTTEADPFNNKISNESPVGSAILGKKFHDVVVANTPAGELSYQIMEVK